MTRDNYAFGIKFSLLFVRTGFWLPHNRLNKSTDEKQIYKYQTPASWINLPYYALSCALARHFERNKLTLS